MCQTHSIQIDSCACEIKGPIFPLRILNLVSKYAGKEFVGK